MLEIVGRIHDTTGKAIPDPIMVEAFKHNFFDSIFPRHIASPVTLDKDGWFKITSTLRFGLDIDKIYLIITDPLKKFVSVKEGQQQKEFSSSTDSHGNRKWKSGIIDDINNIDITIIYQSRPAPSEFYEYVVIGSGFGGTISALTLANKQDFMNKKNGTNSKVCILERGQWWVSHEMPIDASSTTDGNKTIRQHLEENNIPYSTWAYPDNIKGLIRLFANTRTFNSIRGVYDHKAMQNVHVVTASGVGGGSLIYFNITERPDLSVYKHWAIQNNGTRLDSKYSYRDIYGKNADQFVENPVDIDNKVFDYFDIAERFIGVNTITTTAGLGKFKLPRTKAFQNAAKEINPPTHKLMNKKDLDARLSITDIKDGLFNAPHPTKEEKVKYSKENNVCQRQGRCGLGCIPGARHTLNKQLYNAISKGKPLDIFPLCKVDHIEEKNKDVDEETEYKYKIVFKDYRDNTEGVDRIIKTNHIVLSAGTLGSTEILFRSKDYLQLSNKLGYGFSTNGDTFGVISPTKEIVDSSRGPMQTSIARFENSNTDSFEFSIEDLGIPKMFGEILFPIFNLMSLQKKADSFLPQNNFANMFRELIFNKIDDSTIRNLLKRLIGSLDISSSNILTNKIAEIITDLNRIIVDDKTRAQSNDERLRDIMMLFGIGLDNANGQLILDKDRNGLDLKEKYDLDQKIYDNIVDAMKLLSEKIGKGGSNNLIIPFWDQKNKSQITAHPLGGCSMGLDSSQGVVDELGRVFKVNDANEKFYDGLYVIDGSIIPNSLGVNPSLTISALSFRISEHIAGKGIKGQADEDGKQYWPL